MSVPFLSSLCLGRIAKTIVHVRRLFLCRCLGDGHFFLVGVVFFWVGQWEGGWMTHLSFRVASADLMDPCESTNNWIVLEEI